MEAAYPSQWEADVVLRDGETMHIRPVTRADEDAFAALHAGQSEASVYYRFFAPRAGLSERDMAAFLGVDQVRDVSLALFDGAEMRGIGGFDTISPGVAEVAFYIADDEHGRGLGSVLLDHLAAAARDVGIHTFEAFVLPANRKMINVFKDAGYRLRTALDDGVIEVSVDLRSTAQAWRVMMQREQHSEARAMAALMSATEFVVVDDERELLAGLRERLAGAAANPADLTGRLALISAATARLPEILGDLGRRGVRCAIVYSGNRDVDAAAARATLAAARAHGIRLLGPGSYGIVTAEGVDLTLRPGVGLGGTIDVFAQSAEVTVQVLEGMRAEDLAIGTLVAAGHRLDVSGNDTMQYWSAHESAGPALVCLDTIGNARKFVRICRPLAAQRPVVALVTAGTGTTALPGHLVSTSQEGPRVLRDLLAQAGVIATRSMREVLDVTRVLGHQGSPAGRRLGVISSSPALSATVRAAAARHGLRVTGQIDVDLQRPGPLGAAAERMQEECDAVVCALTVITDRHEENLWAALDQIAAVARTVPWVQVIAGAGQLPQAPAAARFADVEPAVRTLGRLAAAQVRRDSMVDVDLVSYPDLEAAEAAAFVRDRVGPGPVALGEDAARDLLARYGIDALASIRASGEEDSVDAARRLGYPVVVKSSRQALRHRADLGGVALDLADEDALRSAVRRFADRGEDQWDVQAMAPPGASCVVRAWEDDLYGPVLAFALAGDAEEILRDVSYRIAPLSELDPREMIEEVAAAVRLHGYRGVPPLDVAALAELIGRLSMLKDDLTDVAEVRLHPVVAGERGVRVAGAQVTVERRRRSDDTRRALARPTD